MHLDNARLVFIDGPIAVYVSEASEQEILDAFSRCGRYVAVAAKQLNPGPPHDPSLPIGTISSEDNARRGGSGGT